MISGKQSDHTADVQCPSHKCPHPSRMHDHRRECHSPFLVTKL